MKTTTLRLMSLLPWCLVLLAPTPQAPLDFARDVLPVLTKAGCNAGSCHGAAVGQGGFRLSLLGYDPEADYGTITRELGGRRVRFDQPALSLVLAKPSGAVAHGGGVRLAEGTTGFEAVRRWLDEGAKPGELDRGIHSIHVLPTEVLGEIPGLKSQITVKAILPDRGEAEDRTDLAIYTPLDESVASVSPTGEVTILSRGVTDIMIRYRGQVASVRVGTPLGEAPVQPGALAGGHPIDEAVFGELKRYRIAPAALSTGGEFLRRASLDLGGRLPTPNEVRAFQSQPDSAATRAALVDGLLASQGFSDLWTMHLADWLLISPKKLQAESSRYHYWLRQQVSANVALDRLAKQLVGAQGSVAEHPETNFYRLAQDPRDMGEFVSRAFLGKRLACARCHNHPYDQWTQTQYHEFAALFARVQFERGALVDNARGTVDHPKTGKPVAPRLFGVGGGSERENVIADRAVWFSEAMANRVWKLLMGRGVVEPVDDLRPTNPPSNPALLKALGKALRDGRYDLRAFVRFIVTSKTYQLSSSPATASPAAARFFAHAAVKPLKGAVLADAIADATGVPDAFPGFGPGTRAVQLPDPGVASYTLDVFGRCNREAACDDDAVAGGGLAQALHVLNSPTIEAKVRLGVAAMKLKGDALVEVLYLRTLSRKPTPQELAATRNADPEDLLWALLNSREFGVVR